MNSNLPQGAYNQQDSRLFGFSYKENDLEELEKISPVPPNIDDGFFRLGGLHGARVRLRRGRRLLDRRPRLIQPSDRQRDYPIVAGLST